MCQRGCCTYICIYIYTYLYDEAEAISSEREICKHRTLRRITMIIITRTFRITRVVRVVRAI